MSIERDPDDLLLTAAMDNDPAAIARLLPLVSDVDKRHHSSGATALHHAALEHAVEAIEALVAAGADVEATDAFGNAPLHHAAFDSPADDAAVRALLAAGADPRGAESRHPRHFDGQSVVTVYDERDVLLRTAPDGRLAAFRQPWIATYSPTDPDDWEHVFCDLGVLIMEAMLAWQIARTRTGSEGRPVQIAALRIRRVPPDEELDAEDRELLGPTTRLAVAAIYDAVQDDRVADPETVALLFAIAHDVRDDPEGVGRTGW